MRDSSHLIGFYNSVQAVLHNKDIVGLADSLHPNYGLDVLVFIRRPACRQLSYIIIHLRLLFPLGFF